MSKKPEGLPEFQSLLGKLAQVPKKQLDKQVLKAARKRAEKRKK